MNDNGFGSRTDGDDDIGDHENVADDDNDDGGGDDNGSGHIPNSQTRNMVRKIQMASSLYE